jgi:hypothetical protein
MRTLFSLLLLVVLLAMGAYYGSPYYVVWRLEQAAKAGDAATVAGLTDLAAVRANLSPSLSAAFQRRVEAERAKPHSLLDRLGMAIAPLFQAKPADVLVTPEGLAILLKTGAAPSYATVYHGGREADWAHPGRPYTLKEGYAGDDLDQFRARVGNRLKPEREVRLTLLRRGFFNWRLTAVDVGVAPQSPAGTAPLRNETGAADPATIPDGPAQSGGATS